jgi:hypothetical protein
VSGHQTATVETLTAEVRVLMVGSRQVTLSVAKQLDSTIYESLEPFGRVRLGDGVKIIGRAADGTLKLADVPDVWVEFWPTGKVRICRRARDKHWLYRIPDDNYRISARHSWELAASSIEWCREFELGHECNPWFVFQDPDDAAGLSEALDDADRLESLRREALALPLIVLAGLK